MTPKLDPFSLAFDSSFKLFHELMAKKVHDILLVSTPYDAWIMEEDGRLSERIVNEYHGLNLSRPPKLSWVASAEEALRKLDEKHFDLVITMPRLADMDAYVLGREIKKKAPDLPVILLSHSLEPHEYGIAIENRPAGIDRSFVWSGNTDLLVALVKSTEDRWNAERDTRLAGVRIILFVEDSPIYASSLLPILYKELVIQTRAVLEDKLNEEHRMLTMRARPRILVAETYEEAVSLFERFEPYVLGVISDVQFPRGGVLDPDAGFDFLSMVKQAQFDIPLLLTSVEPANADRAAQIPAAFVNKLSPNLNEEVHRFFKHNLAFDKFIFRLPDGTEIARAEGLRTLEQALRKIPDESLLYHSERNDFSRWLFTRAENVLASQIRDITTSDFESPDALRQHLINVVHARREVRQQGVVVDFDQNDFDLVTQFFKIGQGSLGGKGRGLAFVSTLLPRNEELLGICEDINIFVPQTLVITTEVFETFVERNDLRYLAEEDVADWEIANRFATGQFPQSIEKDLRAYLTQVDYPLAVRSSSLLEDAQFRAYAGLYFTYMLPNACDSLEERLRYLIQAIKLVYASTYFQSPKAYSKRVDRRIEEEQMAVVIQRLVGERYGDYFYPAMSGVAQSHNYYTFSRLKPEDGIATVAMGLGRTVVEGEKALRFSPRHPKLLPQSSNVNELLDNAQRYFYALKLGQSGEPLEDAGDRANLVKREVAEAADEYPMKLLSSTYVPEENRIRDTTLVPGYRVLTFANVLKYKQFPLADILVGALKMGQAGMGAPVELEFSVNLPQDARKKPEFAFLQLRPMTARAEMMDVDITWDEIRRSFCYSTHALGNAEKGEMADIIYVKPECFDPGKTRTIAQEISHLNAKLAVQERSYLLVGPGRWGTADHWLGIPVQWADISNTGAIIETTYDQLQAEPSQGSHFFHNLLTFGINYITIVDNDTEYLDWEWLKSRPLVMETDYVAWVRLDRPFKLKVDGRTSTCVIYDG